MAASQLSAASSKALLSFFWTQGDHGCDFNTIQLVFEGAKTIYSIPLPRASSDTPRRLNFIFSKAVDLAEGENSSQDAETKRVSRTTESLAARVDQLKTLRLCAIQESESAEDEIKSKSSCPIALSMPDHIEAGATYRLQATGRGSEITAVLVKELPTEANKEKLLNNLVKMLTPSLLVAQGVQVQNLQSKQIQSQNFSVLRITAPSAIPQASAESQAIIRRAIEEIYAQVSSEHLQQSAREIADMEAKIYVAPPDQQPSLRSQFRMLYMNILGEDRLRILATNIVNRASAGQSQVVIAHIVNNTIKTWLS